MKLLISSLIIITALMGCNQSKIDYTSIDAEEIRAWQMDAVDFILLDVRTLEEYNAQHIVDAISLPLNELDEKASSILQILDQPIVLYCRSGNRSAQAAKLLIEKGYTNIYDLGGINNWPYETE